MPDPRPICRCPAYKFSHKAGGGRCNGLGLAQKYGEGFDQLCQTCNLKNEYGCEAIQGGESIKEGNCYEEELRLNG